ncbi:unnamed protein product [Didymodactylos carnosus]|uniref:Uncharacterized protein n=1 Tax=Didymodactylos carnosus TaxID=1234261 RepID=A0A814F0J3_9BILA|nr:unnamed protein product [Didymodactylos carnosus]CAF3747237.1 unnamed protein product [Didymodactylos carnosus]
MNQVCSSTRQNQDIPKELLRPHYTVAIVGSGNQQPDCTRASSDDGFCGSSDISDDCPEQLRPRTISTNAYSPVSPNSVPYTLMKEGILVKQSNSNLDRLSTVTQTSPSYSSLLNRLDNTNSHNTVGSLGLITENSTIDEKDLKSRRVRFNLETDLDTKNTPFIYSQNSPYNCFKQHINTNRTMSQSDTVANYAFERFEKLYMTRDERNNDNTRTLHRLTMLPTSYTNKMSRSDDDTSSSSHSSLFNKVSTFSSPLNDSYTQSITNNYEPSTEMQKNTSYNSTVV